MEPNSILDGTQPELWLDSGFGAPEHMEASHEPLVAVVRDFRFTGNLLDLGSGSGTLLEKLAAERQGVVMHGVEVDEQRAVRSQARLPQARIAAGSMFGPTWEEERYGLVVLMPGRLIGAGERERAGFLRKLRSRTNHVLLYAYVDWLQKYGSVIDLAARCRPVLPRGAGVRQGPPLGGPARPPSEGGCRGVGITPRPPPAPPSARTAPPPPGRPRGRRP